MPANKKPTTKKSSTTKSSTTKSKPVKEPTPTKEETPVVETPVVENTTAVTDTDINYDEDFKVLQDQLRDAMALLKGLVSLASQLEKRVSRDRKVMNKKMRGRVKRVVDPNKPPSGFAKPGPVSDELRKFLGLSADELIARTEVTKRITEYCKEHNLQNKEDRRTIHPNAALKKLLKTKTSDKLTFFNLQKYMKVHYPNKDGVYIHS
jgi:chromatin remodeling complex protein RSC6